MKPALRALALLAAMAITFALIGRWLDSRRAAGDLALCPFCHQEVRN
jgi:hypothetical protein